MGTVDSRQTHSSLIRAPLQCAGAHISKIRVKDLCVLNVRGWAHSLLKDKTPE